MGHYRVWGRCRVITLNSYMVRISCAVLFACIVIVIACSSVKAVDVYGDNVFLTAGYHDDDLIFTEGVVTRLSESDNTFRLDCADVDGEAVAITFPSSWASTSNGTLTLRLLSTDNIQSISFYVDGVFYAAKGMGRSNGITFASFDISGYHFSDSYSLILYYNFSGSPVFFSLLSGYFSSSDIATCPCISNVRDWSSSAWLDDASWPVGATYHLVDDYSTLFDNNAVVPAASYTPRPNANFRNTAKAAYLTLRLRPDLTSDELYKLSSDYYYVTLSVKMLNVYFDGISVTDGVNALPFTVIAQLSDDVVSVKTTSTSNTITTSCYQYVYNSADFTIASTNPIRYDGVTFNSQEYPVATSYPLVIDHEFSGGIASIDSCLIVARVPRGVIPQFVFNMSVTFEGYSSDDLFIQPIFSISSESPDNSFSAEFYALTDELRANNELLMKFFRDNFTALDSSRELDSAVQSVQQQQEQLADMEASYRQDFQTYFDDAGSQLDVTVFNNYASAFDFIASVMTSVWNGMAGWRMVFVFPLFCGLFMYILGRAPNPPKIPK